MSQDLVARFAIVLVVVAAFLLPHAVVATPSHETRRVLVINDLSSVASPGFAAIDQAILAGLAKSSYQIDLYNENLEVSLFPSESFQHESHEWLVRKYSTRVPDIIIAVGEAAIRFVVESHQIAFPNTPVIFCGSTALDQLKLDSHFTGVWAVADPDETLRVAEHLQPGTRHVVVVGGVSAFDRTMEAVSKNAFHRYESQLDFTYLTDQDMPTLLQRLRELPSKTIIYYTSISRDSAGTAFIDATQSVPMVASAANAPVFVMDDVDLGRGTVGGHLISWAADGRVAAQMAVRVLKGEEPENIPIVKNNDVFMFDWRVLRRWGFRESDLPPGSTIMFRELSLWDRAKWVFISGLVVVLFLIVLAIYLQYSRTQLKLARDAQLQLSGLLINAQDREQSRLATELHDDFSQRMAMLTVGLDALLASSDGAKQQLQELKESATELGDDLRNLSHRLHSSTLRVLGLVAGLRALCQDFTARQNVHIDFVSEDVPSDVHPDVALCLFRITQEALQNMKKHSGAAKAEVSLRGLRDKLLLSVRDEGRGFDVGEAIKKPGLGLGSMQGRANLLGGSFEIHSAPGQGTRIEVCVPLHAEPNSLTNGSIADRRDLPQPS